MLRIARKVISGAGIGLPKITALSYYCGEHFKYLDKELFQKSFINQSADMLILNNRFGIVHAFEKIEPYSESHSKGLINKWIKLGLPEIIADYIKNTLPSSIYWFHRKNTRYWKVILSVVQIIHKRRIKSRIYHVYPYACRNPQNIYKALGYGINQLLSNNTLPLQIDKCILVKEKLTVKYI